MAIFDSAFRLSILAFYFCCPRLKYSEAILKTIKKAKKDAAINIVLATMSPI